MKVKSGFTLIEVLLSLAIGALLLASAVSLFFSVSNAWLSGPSKKMVFDAHVDGVAYFMSSLLEESSKPPLGKAGQSEIDLRRPMGFSDTDAPLIHFYLPQAPSLFFWPRGSATRVHAYLLFNEDDGLSILWFSDLQELEETEEGTMEPPDEEDYFNTSVSPYCTKIEYGYFGEEGESVEDAQWEWMEELDEGRDGYRLPEFIRLVFEMEELREGRREVILPIIRPSPSGLREESG